MQQKLHLQLSKNLMLSFVVNVVRHIEHSLGSIKIIVSSTISILILSNLLLVKRANSQEEIFNNNQIKIIENIKFAKHT